MFYGIPEAVLFSEEMLDRIGAVAEGSLRDAQRNVDAFFEKEQVR